MGIYRPSNLSWRNHGYCYSYGGEPDVKVTPREVIFSVLIVGILFSIGFLVAGTIKKHVDERNLVYRQAIQIRDSGAELKQACDTDVGNAFVEGDFKAIDMVTWEGLDGEHLWIRRDKEKYTMHTRTVRYTVHDSKGRPHTRTRTETYWTWDVVKSDKKHSKEVSFCGNAYLYETFSYDMVSSSRHVRGTGWHTRDVFRYMPKEFRGSIYAMLKSGTINDCPTIWEGATNEDLYKRATSSMAVGLFWTIWTIFMIVVVVMFVVLDNRWLEDREKED